MMSLGKKQPDPLYSDWTSMSGNFIKLNLMAPVFLAIGFAIIYVFATFDFALSMMPVSVELMPYFALVASVSLQFFIAFSLIMSRAFTTGWNNQHPQNQTYEGVQFRHSSALKNQIESNGYATAFIFVCTSLKCTGDATEGCVPGELLARASLLFLLARLCFTPLYLLNLDFMRSLVWFCGFWSLLLVSLTPFTGIASLV